MVVGSRSFPYAGATVSTLLESVQFGNRTVCSAHQASWVADMALMSAVRANGAVSAVSFVHCHWPLGQRGNPYCLTLSVQFVAGMVVAASSRYPDDAGTCA